MTQHGGKAASSSAGNGMHRSRVLDLQHIRAAGGGQQGQHWGRPKSHAAQLRPWKLQPQAGHAGEEDSQGATQRVASQGEPHIWDHMGAERLPQLLCHALHACHGQSGSWVATMFRYWEVSRLEGM